LDDIGYCIKLRISFKTNTAEWEMAAAAVNASAYEMEYRMILLNDPKNKLLPPS
jgi:hypothetical protein